MSVFYKRAISEIKAVNWKEALQSTVADIINNQCLKNVKQHNDEYAKQAKIASNFIIRVLARKVVDPEIFFFALQYFFLLIDEEHSFLKSFKYQGLLRAFNIIPTLIEHDG